jgi:hypothetical protein
MHEQEELLYTKSLLKPGYSREYKSQTHVDDDDTLNSNQIRMLRRIYKYLIYIMRKISEGAYPKMIEVCTTFELSDSSFTLFWYNCRIRYRQIDCQRLLLYVECFKGSARWLRAVGYFPQISHKYINKIFRFGDITLKLN